MFCKECGTENSNNSLRCKKCNTYLISSNSPLSGGDKTKIILFFAFLILPFAWFGGSVIIILISIFSLYIMKNDKSFSPINKAKKYIKIYLIVLALIITTISTFAYHNENKRNFDWNKKEYIYNKNINVETGMVAVGGLIATPIVIGFFMFIFNSLFFRTLEEHQNWVINNGLFSNESNMKKNSVNIVGRDNLSSFSIADEMLKWNELLEKGLITKEEFDNAKVKLLNGEKV